MKVKNESEVAQLCPTLSDPMAAAHQVPPSMGFSRQEYWSGLPLPSQIQQLILHLIYLFKNIYLFETIESELWHVGFLLQYRGFSVVVLLGLSSCDMWA